MAHPEFIIRCAHGFLINVNFVLLLKESLSAKRMSYEENRTSALLTLGMSRRSAPRMKHLERLRAEHVHIIMYLPASCKRYCDLRALRGGGSVRSTSLSSDKHARQVLLVPQPCLLGYVLCTLALLMLVCDYALTATASNGSLMIGGTKCLHVLGARQLLKLL